VAARTSEACLTHIVRVHSGILAQSTLQQPGSGFEPGCRVSALVALPSTLAILVEEQTRIEAQASSRITGAAERDAV